MNTSNDQHAEFGAHIAHITDVKRMPFDTAPPSRHQLRGATKARRYTGQFRKPVPAHHGIEALRVDIWGDAPSAPLGLGGRQHISDQQAQSQCEYPANRCTSPSHDAIVESQTLNKKAANRTAFARKLR